IIVIRNKMTNTFLDEIKNHILLFDGAMGTEIQKLKPKAEDFPNNKDGFNDGLVLSKPEWIKNIHRSYLEAGSDCIETNTFGSNQIKLQEYGFGDQTVSINKSAAELARSVIKELGNGEKFVAGSMGPTGYLPSSNDPDLGNVPLNTIIEAFELQAQGLIQGGVDVLLIETSQDILEVKLAITGSLNAMEKIGKKVPIISNVTLDKYGKMLLGTNVQSAYTTVSDMGVSVFGLNCSTGPVEMESSIRWLDEQNELPILVMPNAGMPINEGGNAVYKMTSKDMSHHLGEFIKKYKKVRMIGGCCGTTPEHIRELKSTLKSYNL
ncbi:MAG TPA: homocysteine S-methyltransferase family protein, partial [Nitrososphaeraceae archaeon]|nr:homocysteine S-methyltransferase family protein [Nitrososphaeraceae archaeon]